MEFFCFVSTNIEFSAYRVEAIIKINQTYMSQKLSYQPLYEDQDKYWSTYDLGVCCSLISLHFIIAQIDRANPRKVRFVFKRNKKLEQAVEDYFADRLSFNPRTLLDNQKMIKNMLYSDI